MNIEIKHCNNIDFASISLVENKLNIKFAPNGSGKSSIARALLLSIANGQDQLSELMPFKYRRKNPENKRPEVSGIEDLRSAMCFNEEYVSQFVFSRMNCSATASIFSSEPMPTKRMSGKSTN